MRKRTLEETVFITWRDMDWTKRPSLEEFIIENTGKIKEKLELDNCKKEKPKEKIITTKIKASRKHRLRTENSRNIEKNKKFYIVLRQMAKDRDGNRCVECGKTESLHSHHIVERGNGGTDDISNLVTLCPLCHANKHKGQPVYNILIKQATGLLKKG